MQVLRRNKNVALNCGFFGAETPLVVTELLTALQEYDDTWTADVSDMTGEWSLASLNTPIGFIVAPSSNGTVAKVYDRDSRDIYSRECEAQELRSWIQSKIDSLQRIEDAYKKILNEESLNANLSYESAQRIKNVFRAAQEAVEFPRGFRYTAFRQNNSEDCVLSTLEFTSQKLGAKQWVVKSALAAAFTDEVIPGSRSGQTVDRDSWSFQPEYDPDGRGSDRGDGIRRSDRLYTFQPSINTTQDPDKQAAYWLVGILQKMVDDILDNPPNRVYEFFLAEGLLRKKNLATMSDMGLIRLAKKGVITGPEILKAKPQLWKKLLEKNFITGEQAFKAQPNQLLWLTLHDYIPVERAIKIDPSIQDKLLRYGKVPAATDITTKDIDLLLQYVEAGTLTPQKAWSLNQKVLKPMIEAGLIQPMDAYKLEPSILNWMLENHYIGRAEAKRLKPRIEEEMRKKGVDWESLEASKRLRSTRGEDRLIEFNSSITDEADDTFYVSVDQGALIMEISKSGSHWEERKLYEDEDFAEEWGRFRSSSYMGYLSKGEILHWIRKDYSSCLVEEVSADEVEDFLYGDVEDYGDYEVKEFECARRSKFNISALQGALETTVIEFMSVDPEIGFSIDEAKEYSKVEVSPTDDGNVCAEVRAELSFGSLMRLADKLNPIVEAIDPYAYFDAVSPGILNAYIETSGRK